MLDPKIRKRVMVDDLTPGQPLIRRMVRTASLHLAGRTYLFAVRKDP